MFKRLGVPTGMVAINSPKVEDKPNELVRAAVIVHAGAEKSALEFLSSDGPIVFDDARIKRVVEKNNAARALLVEQYGGEDKFPIGAATPLLDHHTSESNDQVVGRLPAPYRYELRDLPKVGKNVPCAITDITFLGAKTCEKVLDGRIYHLSVGISETTDLLGEVSTVVDPAAPGAMLLKQGKGGKIQTTNGGKQMAKKTKSLVASANRLAKLSAMNEELTKMVSKNTETKGLMKLTARKGEITHRLKKLCGEGKMTPAEYRNLVTAEDLTKLAALDDSTLKIALKPYEAREKPVIDPVQRGSQDATTFSDLGKSLEKSQLRRLKSEVKGDFRRMGKKLEKDEDEENEKKMGGGNNLEPVNPGHNPHSVPGQQGVEAQLAAHMSAMGKHLEAGDVEKAKECHKKMSSLSAGGDKHLEMGGDVKGEDYQASMAALEQRIDETATQMGRLAGMVQELMAVEKNEGHEELQEENTEEQPAAAAV